MGRVVVPNNPALTQTRRVYRAGGGHSTWSGWLVSTPLFPRLVVARLMVLDCGDMKRVIRWCHGAGPAQINDFLVRGGLVFS